MNDLTKKVIKAALVGAVAGIAYTFIVDPLINKPLEKQVEKVLSK